VTAPAIPFTDVDGAVRAWARDTVPVVERRVFFAPNNKAPFPQIRVWRLPSVDEAALFQFDVWGGSLQDAQDIANALANAAERLGRYTHGDTVLLGAVVERKSPQPDPESDRPRVVVDVTFTAVAVSSS
jgi:hypothetical protein